MVDLPLFQGNLDWWKKLHQIHLDTHVSKKPITRLQHATCLTDASPISVGKAAEGSLVPRGGNFICGAIQKGECGKELSIKWIDAIQFTCGRTTLCYSPLVLNLRSSRTCPSGFGRINLHTSTLWTNWTHVVFALANSLVRNEGI